MTRQPGTSAAFSAAGRLLSRPALRPITRTFSNLHAAMYRLTRGKAQNRKYPTMLLTVTGRRSGRPQTVPLIYVEDAGRFVVAAAYAGSDTDPAWWRNLQANPRGGAGERRKIRRRGGARPGGSTPRVVAAADPDVSVLRRISAADEPADPRGDAPSHCAGPLAVVHQPVEHPCGPVQRIGGPGGQTENDGALDGGHDGGGQRFGFVGRDHLVS